MSLISKDLEKMWHIPAAGEEAQAASGLDPDALATTTKAATNAFYVRLAVSSLALVGGIFFGIRKGLKWWYYLLLILLIAPAIGMAAGALAFAFQKK